MSVVDSPVPKPTRPCTEYNIFFQLERAHVLQVELGSEPSLDGLEAFRPEQPSYAGMPPLPSRYASLVLPYDWHLPGKEKRRKKRKHRKTHGAIGFHELSDAISAAWKEIDDEIKSYCARVCEMGVAKYKAELKEWRRSGGEDQRGGAAAVVKETAKVKKKKKAIPKKPPSAERKPPQKADDERRPSLPNEFDLGAFLKDVHFDDEAQGDEALAPAMTADGVMSSEATHEFVIDPVPLEQPSSERFLAAAPFEISTEASLGLAKEVFTKEIFERNASIVSHETVDMDDDEILGMWNDGGGDADVVDSDMLCREIAPVVESAPKKDFDGHYKPAFGTKGCHEPRDVDGYKSAFGVMGYEVTMEEVCRLKKVLEGQARVLEGSGRPAAARHRRRSVTACCA